MLRSVTHADTRYYIHVHGLCSPEIIYKSMIHAPTEARRSSPLLYMYQGLISNNTCCLIGGSMSEKSQESRLVEPSGLAMGSPSSSISSSFSLIQSQWSPASVHWLGVRIYVCLNQLLVETRFTLCPNMYLILEKVSYVIEKKVQSLLFEWNYQ